MAKGARVRAEVVDAPVEGNRWTFLTNHAHVLIVLEREPGVVLRNVASKVGITERAVQRIVQDLEEGGFVKIDKIGRQNRYQVNKDLPLRHPLESHCTIGQLLRLVSSGNVPRTP
jgi:uncharacterized membrane protein